MKYLIISDIHGSLPRLQRALEFYDSHHCDMLLIGGDILNYGPRNTIPEGIDAKGVAQLLNEHADHIVSARGNCEAEVDQALLHFPVLGDYALIVDEGRRILLTHGHKYNPEQLPPGYYDAVITGHTHLWELKTNAQGTLCCNVGSITFPKNGNPPTFAIMEHGVIDVYTLDGNKLASAEMKKKKLEQWY